MTALGRAQRSGVSFILLTMVPCLAQGQSGAPPEDRRAAEAAITAMTHDHASHDPHLVLSGLRVPSAADSARAAELLSVIRRELERFRDVDSARAAGFEPFLPGVPQPVYHYVNWISGLFEQFGFNPARPTALLYRKESDGRLTLTGAMYTAPAFFDEDALDRRIPASFARWHQHVSWCIPRARGRGGWMATRDGKPLFGPESPIATREACEQAGGRFLPRLFGWMVHINAFESDPQLIWGDHH